MVKQRSRVEWLCEGDRNTGYFHAIIKQRSRANKILALKRPDGSLCTTQAELEDLAMNFYKNLFTAQDQTSPEEILQFVPTKVTPAMYDLLTAPFTEGYP
jgi:hypothetical protein